MTHSNSRANPAPSADLDLALQLRERERQLESLLGHLPGLAYRALADEHWTALFVSKGVEELTGYLADEFTSRRLNYADIMLPEGRPATREAVFVALAERKMYEAEHRIRHKDGSVRWIWARGHGVFAPDGSLRFIEGLNLDMTRQKQAEERLRESEQRWRSLTEALPQLVWCATPDGACDYLSRQWTQHTGAPERDLMGWRWLQFLHPDDREPTRLLWTDSVAGRGPYDVEYRVRRSDGVYRWFKTRGTPIHDSAESPVFGMERRYLRKDGRAVWVEVFASFQCDASGRPAYAIAAVQDILERKRLEGELWQAKEVAETANRAKDEFLANVRRSPLASRSILLRSGTRCVTRTRRACAKRLTNAAACSQSFRRSAATSRAT